LRKPEKRAQALWIEMVDSHDVRESWHKCHLLLMLFADDVVVSGKNACLVGSKAGARHSHVPA